VRLLLVGKAAKIFHCLGSECRTAIGRASSLSGALAPTCEPSTKTTIFHRTKAEERHDEDCGSRVR